MRFPVGPNSVSLGLGYFERVKLSHINDKPTWLSFDLMQYLVFHAAKYIFPNNFSFFYFIQFAFLQFHTSYFVNFFQQIFYYDSFILL
ncbi:hypothetical protein T4D_2315 [Trichinella pseudospiralis]|uniref:Uncharacterized protein n=1 Tax=Trichinella pseudospiralis TaxID=6337 RepID=A0A0V1FLF3_TRIPS|nr:hypothetical protein T4D_2315 [Trichinella pseudospiralis]